MVFGILFPVAVLVAGITLLTICSDKAVEHSVSFASKLGFSSLIVGLVLVSIGTDLPEIANSIFSCWSGHGDIDLGDSFGSILSQITLILGVIAILGRRFAVERREILVIGAFTILSLGLSILVAATGFGREKALLLIILWPIFIFMIRKLTSRNLVKIRETGKPKESHYLYHLAIAVLGYIGVAVGAVAVVQSVILLSDQLVIPEYFISFFIVGIGTSIPELVVDITAVRKRQYELAIGDIVGSCMVDATVSISMGQLLFPTPVFVEAFTRSLLLALYAMIAVAIVIATLALRKKVDRKAGIFFIMVYLVSYLLLYMV